jgi:hypothetical protein
MKTLVYLFVIAMFLFAGCAKDEMFTDDADINLKSAEVKGVPLKGDFYSVPTAWDETGMMSAGYLVGNITHLGKLIPELSTFDITEADLSTYPNIVYWMEGQLAAANGDLLFYTIVGTADMTIGTVEADVTYTGGTGRLEKYTGSAHFTGQTDPETGYTYCTTEGVLYK